MKPKKTVIKTIIGQSKLVNAVGKQITKKNIFGRLLKPQIGKIPLGESLLTHIMEVTRLFHSGQFHERLRFHSTITSCSMSPEFGFKVC